MVVVVALLVLRISGDLEGRKTATVAAGHMQCMDNRFYTESRADLKRLQFGPLTRSIFFLCQMLLLMTDIEKVLTYYVWHVMMLAEVNDTFQFGTMLFPNIRDYFLPQCSLHSLPLTFPPI
jgi:hypothetical protein